ncbi:MAG: FHA domain-containing protein, partial [Bacteroidales bacterium]|nr:FHA domain-containing protein [Bacteroidales bacterium]
GWLVSYSLDKMGVDFRLYEGRNIIGRDMDCNITVNDNMVSGRHAVLLFRADKYSLTDQQSTHGTFVNGNDIDLEPCYLQDGDVIKVGETVFKFRTSF